MQRRLRALYVTDRFDGPYRYRCQQACEQLRKDGAVANVMRIEDPRLLRTLRRYGVIVLFRLPWSEQVASVVHEARAAGIPLVFDIDDLTFDPEFASLMPFRRRYTAEKWAATYGRQMTSLRRTLDACDVFVGSTRELAEQAARLGKTAHVHPNVVPDFYLELGKWLSPLKRDPTRRPTIGYFSGSDTHDEDFESIGPALERVLREVPGARLLVVGYLELGRRHPILAQRATRLPYMHWKDFAVAYAACHVTLAPLSVRNSFTDCKSALKFFEAGAFSTPVVATPIREMRDAIVHGETGYLAETEDEWVRSVVTCLDPGASSRVGRAARAAVERSHSTVAHRGRLHALLDGLAVAGEGRAPAPTLLDPPDETGMSTPIARALRPVRAARDFAQIVRTLREDAPEGFDSSLVERCALGLLREGKARRNAERVGAVVFDPDDLSRWRPGDHVGFNGRIAGELHSTGSDPQLTSRTLSIETSKIRYVVVKIRAAAEPATVQGQLYFKSGEAASYSEESSIAFPVDADGTDATVVVDLASAPASRKWRKERFVTHLRLDPMDARGSFRVSGLVLLPPLDTLPYADPPEWVRPSLELLPTSLAARRQIEEQLPVRDSDRLAIHLAGAPSEARKALEGWLFGLPVAVEDIRNVDDGVVATLAPGFGPPTHGVDIVVPIFNAKELSLRCLSSVLAHAKGEYRLVAIDDASTDPEVYPALLELAETSERMIVLQNSENLGFVGTANRGMRNARGRDVLLLNSDTEVFAEFLERLVDAAYSDRRGGLVSPLSNNATICSVPEFCRMNTLPQGVTASEIANIVARSSSRRRPELVTPHGFCLYLRSDVIETLGFFDEGRFGRGFGEENDFGERAKSAGYRTLLADDVYVWHEGKASFGQEGQTLEGHHGKVLENRHPGYHAAVALFVRENPLRDVQDSVRRHLLRKSHRVEPSSLLVLHASPFGEAPGGVEHCVRDLVSSMAGPRTVFIYPSGGDLEVAEVFDGNLSAPILYRFRLGYPPDRFCHEHAEAARAFEEILRLFHIGWVHVHHLMFLPLSFARVLGESGLPYVVAVHDFYAGCPSFNLLDMRDMSLCCPGSCGDAKKTEACQRELFTRLGHPLPPDLVAFVTEHRRRFQALFDGAELVTFPSESSRSILSRLLDLASVRAEVVAHGHILPAKPAHAAKPGEHLRIAIVGQVAYPSKGAESYLSLMQVLSGEPIEWHVFGRTDLFAFDERLSALGPSVSIIRHGPYHRDAIVERLVEAGVDLAVHLPAWPETFSYTLSEMLAAGLPVVARRIGALQDRLDGAECAVLVDDVRGAADTILRLHRNRDELRRMADSVPEVSDTRAWADFHRTLYERCRELSTTKDPRPLTPVECARLNEIAFSGGAASDSIVVTAPSSRYASAWWFRYAERVKPYAPESIRQVVRRKLSGDGSLPVARFRLPGGPAHVKKQLRVKRRYVATTLLVSQGSDPYIELQLEEPLDPRTVDLVRFNLWCSTPRAAFAQLFWQSETRRHFDEHHSVTVPLNGPSASWQEYVVRLNGSSKASAWYEGGAIVALRFDPIDLPGLIGLGEIAFCAYPVD